VQALDCSSLRVRGPVLDRTSCFIVECSSPRWTRPIGEGFRPCQKGPSQCHGDYDDYAGSLGYVRWRRDGFQHLSTGCQTRMGSCGYVLLCHALNVTTSRGPNVGRAYPGAKSPEQSNWMPRSVLGQGARWNGLTSGEILLAHDYHNEGKRWYGLLSGLVLFRLVATPLQLGVVGPCLVRDGWFPSHLLLVGTGRI
jgi:hypothetical protein